MNLKEGGGGFPPARLGAVSFLAFLLLACCFPTFEGRREGGTRPARKSGVVRTAPAEGGTTQKLWFSWEDPYSSPVVDRRGDAFVTDGAVPAAHYAVRYEMDLRRLRWAEETYGVPDSWAEFQYRSEEELSAQFSAARSRCALHGIRLEMEGNALHLSADGDWIVENSRGDLAPLAASLRDEAEEKDRKDERGFLSVVASFVQGLEYRLPPDERRDGDGNRIATCGVTMPLETLRNAAGDCDTKCFLLASILSNVEGMPTLLLEGQKHMFIGVASTPQPGDRFVRVQGIDYLLIEVTYPWPLGAVPQDIEEGLQANRYKVTPVHPEP